ncbi:MAG: hypothetical protein LBD50_01830 [Rickettsiales bacterium]|nr:hypothetical protein [Rickettsiales bacterium]
MTTSISGLLTTNTSSAASLIADAECIDAYTSCAKGADVCGPDFEECTNKTLFYAKKPQCASTLMQCKTTGITSLFGTSAQTAFSNKNSNGEYVYPTAGSVLGQLIEAAYINNRYDTSTCVKRYTSCLKKDDVCGADFELCTSNTEFKKQKLFCESTLARCQADGLTELFGTTTTAANPTANSRLGIMISEGAALAAVNAVATCYKVADQCILNACATNPYKCKEGSEQTIVDITETINNTDGTTTTTSSQNIMGAVNRNEISGFIKNACQDTIGANKFCYATFLGNGAMPTNAQLRDEENKDAIYSEAYSSRMNDSMKSKIDALIEKFDKKTKQHCQDTIVNCAMRSCGEGSGAACYASAFNSSNTVKGVTNPSTMSNIKYGCEAVVNNDTSCKYASATFTTAGVINFLESSLFDTLFTAPDNTDVSKPDAVGAVAALNARLSTSYNQAALDQMKKQCQTVATGCVRTMCGNEYTNCYRNRTDVSSTLTNTGEAAFDKSMNKVGGVLDYTIVLGLCLNTVKINPVCEEHIKAEAARRSASSSYTANSWGSAGSTRDGWLGAGVYSATGSTSEYQDIDADGNMLCTTSKDNGGQIGRCDDISGTYIYPYMISETSYKIEQAERTVFRDLVYDLEKEAQAQYNAKLTKQQNMCISSNNGGIVGTKDTGSTFMWVKLRNNKVPKSYATAGLKANDFVTSNELYGSFCRIRVVLQSDEKHIQDAISAGKDWGIAYFAAGDPFTCGSWIPQRALEEISSSVGKEAEDEKRRGDDRTRGWITALGSVVGGVGGGIGMNALQKGSLGGLLGTTNKTDTVSTNVSRCQSFVKNYKSQPDGVKAESIGTAAINAAREIGDLNSDIGFIETAVGDAATAENRAKSAENLATLATAENKATVDTAARDERLAATNAKNVANQAMDTLSDLCKSEATSAKSSSSKTIGNLVGAGVGAVAGGVLGYTITKSVQDAAAEGANAEARKAWMEEVGNHIRCYIGSDEVGSYGDMISTEME